ncbi:MAG: ATPase, T2SS/T4P/T4SS family, partial [Rubripirellula sp.]
QSELDPSGGMTLASALRNAVRQDSEVLLVSETRDPETAEAAMQASLTGHLVFSSLHASDVASALRRLIQLGVPHYVIRSGVRAIISQRLLRKVCETCRQGTKARQPQGSEGSVGRSGTACESCAGVGYLGRLALAQIVCFDGSDPVGEALADSLEAGASAAQMRAAAAGVGGIDLFRHAQDAVDRGLTDMDEVYRVLGRSIST